MAEIRGELQRPIVEPQIHCMENPYVDQNAATIVTYASLLQLNPDINVIQTTEYAGATISIYRYRRGTDAGFTAIVNAVAMTEAAGYATYAYTFPNASWQDGDQILYQVSGIVVTLLGHTYTLPSIFRYGTVASLGTDLRTQQSESGPVEEDEYEMFWISIYDIDLGPVPSASIDITGISATMEKSTGGADFSSVGITQPTFAKADGRVYCSYRFLNAEWKEGDLYKLVVSGITATVDTGTVYIPAMVWSNIILGVTSEVGIFHEQPDVAVNVTAIVGGVNILDLSTADTRYILRDLVLKGADPGSDTITINLYKLVNDVQTLADTFVINTANYDKYYDLMDMFGVADVAGDDILITAVSSANSYAVTGQYSYAKTNV